MSSFLFWFVFISIFLTTCFTLIMSLWDTYNKYEMVLKQCEEASVYQCEIKAVAKGDGHE